MATLTGIYKITNTINGKCYVGQSVNITKRWQYYQYGSRDNTPILSAIRKYGRENFTFEIIEECDRELLNDREIFWIKELLVSAPNGYNLSTGGRKTTWLYKPSKETLQKRSVALTGKKRTLETRLKMSNSQKGKTASEETKEKLRQSHLGQKPWNKGIPMSESAKRKLSESKTGKPAPWKNVAVERSDGVVFNSVKEAASAINATYRGVIRVCRGERKKIYGYSFTYAEGGLSSQL